MNYRSTMEEKEHLTQQRVPSMAAENDWLGLNAENWGYHTEENLNPKLPLVGDKEQQRPKGEVPEYPLILKLPNCEENFDWENYKYVLLDGEEEAKMMQELNTLEDEEEEKFPKQKSLQSDEGRCIFCCRTIVSEGDESEHYRNCPEYNRWYGSENNSFYYSPQYSSSSNGSGCSPSPIKIRARQK